MPVEDTILAVEIISPTSEAWDTRYKKKLYAAAGVDSYWIIDPCAAGNVLLIEYILGDRGFYEQIRVTDKVFTTEIPHPVIIDLPAFTALRDED